MKEWLAQNLMTLTVFLVLVLIVSLAVRSLWKGRKKGCAGDCSHCQAACFHKLPDKL